MKRALYIGRFNPFHIGHLKAIEYIFESDKSIDQLIIGIGTAQESFTPSNPFTSGERFEFIFQALRKSKITSEKYFIVPIPDVNNNNLWISYLVSLLPPFSIIYSNNPLVKLLTKNFKEIEIREVPLVNRKEWSATLIRKLMVENKVAWEKFVPEPVKAIISDINGVERIQILAKNDV